MRGISCACKSAVREINSVHWPVSDPLLFRREEYHRRSGEREQEYVGWADPNLSRIVTFAIENTKRQMCRRCFRFKWIPMPIPGADCSHMLFLPPGNGCSSVVDVKTLFRLSIPREKRAGFSCRDTLYIACDRTIISRDISISQKKNPANKSVIDKKHHNPKLRHTTPLKKKI